MVREYDAGVVDLKVIDTSHSAIAVVVDKLSLSVAALRKRPAAGVRR